jgi:hypothetical protein
MKKISLFVCFVVGTILQSCDKEICRECYLIRSSLNTYTDTTLSPYLIPGDTVKTYQSCDKEGAFKSDKFKEEKYEYDGPSLFFPRYNVHVVVTDITKCPE